MPTRPPRVCGCGHRVASGTLCACEARRKAERHKAHDAKRPSARARGYTTEWQAARVEYLADNPYCVECGAKATEVDHIKPHRMDARLFWDRSNWQPMCKSHHSRKTARHDRTSTPRVSTDFWQRP